MLTVAKITAGVAQGYAEYLEGKATATQLGDYYLKDGERVEAPGRWVSGAPAVDLDPDEYVESAHLKALMAVKHPITHGPLRRAGGNGEIVAAIDATFSAPKSVSAVWALGSPDLRAAVERAHETAIDRAMSYALSQVAMIRERIDQSRVVHRRAREMIATSWRHTTARTVDAHPPDPQLHSHVLLHGAVRGDRRIMAIDSRAWFQHRREVGAAYRSELALELHRLGFGIERGTGRAGRYFEISGIPRELIDRWSSRHHQVARAIQDRLETKRAVLRERIRAGGPDAEHAAKNLRALRDARLSPAEDRHVSRFTRAPKTGLRTHGDLDRHWSTTARVHDVDATTIEWLRTDQPTIPPADDQELLARLTEFDATFPARDARAVAVEASTGAGILASLAGLEQLRGAQELLRLADGTATTHQHRAAERATVDTATRIIASRVERVPEQLVHREANVLDRQLQKQGSRLSAEQRLALELGCSDRQLVMIEGQAGTGKSTVLRAIARAHQADGRHIIVTSTGALAAQRLATELQGAGVCAESFSTVGLQAAIRTGRLTLTPESTIIHDEAALASTREQHALLAAVEGSGARLIEVGDPRQSQAVGAAGLWPSLEHTARSNEARVELTRNVRAKDPADRRDQALFRRGEHEQALLGYHTRGRTHIAVDQQRAEDHALDAAQHDRRHGNRTIVITQASNEHLDELNARAQAIRLQDGELGQANVFVPSRPYDLHSGDEVQIRRSLTHERLGRLPNGTTATVIRSDPDQHLVTIRLFDGRAAALTANQLADADMRLAYVQHPFPAQGTTTDTAHLIVGEHATREGSYVALTRARNATHIHASEHQLEAAEERTNQISSLSDHMSRSEPAAPSIAFPLAHEQHIAAEAEPAASAADVDGSRPTGSIGRPDGHVRSAKQPVRSDTLEALDADHHVETAEGTRSPGWEP